MAGGFWENVGSWVPFCAAEPTSPRENMKLRSGVIANQCCHNDRFCCTSEGPSALLFLRATEEDVTIPDYPHTPQGGPTAPFQVSSAYPGIRRQTNDSESHTLRFDEADADADAERQGSKSSRLSKSHATLSLDDVIHERSIHLDVVDCEPLSSKGRKRNSWRKIRQTMLEHRENVHEDFRVDLPNALVKWLWPSITEYISTIILTNIEPSIKQALTTALGSLGSSFAFDRARCHLGTTPVEVLRLAGHETMEGDTKNVTFTALIRWQGVPEVFFSVSKVELGVKSVTFQGIVTVECCNIQPRPLFFEGVRMFFVNPPEFDINFEGSQRLSSLLNMAAIKSMILGVVLEQVGKRLVAPNCVGKVLSPGADWFRIARPVPSGVVVITVHSCEGLPATDINFIRPNTSDPYVMVRSGAEKFKSHVVKKNCSPKFNFVSRFLVANEFEQHVMIELKDHDMVSKDDFLGKLVVPVKEIQSWEEGKYCFELADESGRKGSNGKIWISADYRPILRHSHELTLEVDSNEALIFAGVYECTQVPQMAPGTKFWIEVECEGAWRPNRSAPTVQSTEKLDQHGAHWLAKDRQAQEQLMRHRLSLLRKYKVSTQDMAQILGVDESQLGTMDASQMLGTSELIFNTGFEYFVDEQDKAVISFTLKCMTSPHGSKKSSHEGKETKLGTFAVSSAELKHEPVYKRTVVLPGSHISMKLLVEMFFSWLMPW